MVQVTMTGSEYTDLVRMKTLVDSMTEIKAMQFEEGSLPRVDTSNLFQPLVVKLIAENVTQQLGNHPEAIKELVREEKHVLNVRGGYFTSAYGRLDEEEYEMLSVPAFRKMWDKATEEKEQVNEDEE